MKNEFINNFDEQTKNLKGAKLLLHCCCAPCSSATLEALNKHFQVTVYFYNPNIQPLEEFERRAKEQQRFLTEHFFGKIPLTVAPYEGEEFDKIASGLENEPERGKRCFLCYKQRMEKTALYAKEKGFEAFTTSLSISPHKNALWINQIGKELEAKYGVTFIYSDFKKREGYKRSIELSKQYNLYRQDYCGCKYSKKDDTTK